MTQLYIGEISYRNIRKYLIHLKLSSSKGVLFSRKMDDVLNRINNTDDIVFFVNKNNDFQCGLIANKIKGNVYLEGLAGVKSSFIKLKPILKKRYSNICFHVKKSNDFAFKIAQRQYIKGTPPEYKKFLEGKDLSEWEGFYL